MNTLGALQSSLLIFSAYLRLKSHGALMHANLVFKAALLLVHVLPLGSFLRGEPFLKASKGVNCLSLKLY